MAGCGGGGAEGADSLAERLRFWDFSSALKGGEGELAEDESALWDRHLRSVALKHFGTQARPFIRSEFRTRLGSPIRAALGIRREFEGAVVSPPAD